jgi:hypothetical protein
LYGNPEAQAHDAQTLQRHDLIAFGLPCPQERLRAIVIAFAALLVAGLKRGTATPSGVNLRTAPRGAWDRCQSRNDHEGFKHALKIDQAVQQDGQDRGAGYPTKPSEHQPIH